MAKAIRVIVTKTYTYMPNLEEESYLAKKCHSIEDALLVDKNDVESGDSGLEEIAYAPPVITYKWSIVDE